MNDLSNQALFIEMLTTEDFEDGKNRSDYKKEELLSGMFNFVNTVGEIKINPFRRSEILSTARLIYAA